MMRRPLIIICTLVPVLAGISLCSCRSPKPETWRIVLTCDTRGRLEPCGCFTGQMGGLTRIDSLLETPKPPRELRLDAGDALSGYEDYHVIQYRYLLDAYRAMDFDVMNMGGREARLSADQLRALRSDSPVPLVSANLRATTGERIFEPYHMLQRAGRTIAVVGVVDPDRGPDNLGEGVVAEDLFTSLSNVLPQIKDQADLVVLLAFADEQRLAELAQRYYEVDVILGGKVSQPSQSLEQVNQSMIFYITNQARALGILDLGLDHRDRVTPRGHEVILVHDRVPQSERMREMAGAYRREVRQTRLAVDDPELLRADEVPGVEHRATYVGSAACQACHEEAYSIWKDSGHAEAFDALVRRGADADPGCIECHTVGFGHPDGYRREFGEERLIHVGCESCHGPGSLHAQQHEANAEIPFAYRPLGAGDCRQCHHGEFSRPFDWDRFWPPIEH